MTRAPLVTRSPIVWVLSVVGGFLLSCGRPEALPPPVAAAPPSTSAASAQPASFDSGKEIRAALDRAPFLSRAAAEALVADQQRRGATVADLPEAGITAAIGAIPFLPPDGVRA